MYYNRLIQLANMLDKLPIGKCSDIARELREIAAAIYLTK